VQVLSPRPPSLPTTPAATTKVARNPNFAKLQAGYLFPEVGAADQRICTQQQTARRASKDSVNPPSSSLTLASSTTTPQIARRRRAHQEQHPDAKIISLGIGDTTEPLPPFIANAMAKAAAGLATREGYSG
jgi:hypothetical protein